MPNPPTSPDTQGQCASVPDRALVPAASNPQAVSTKGFDPSREDATIEVIMAAVALAFNPSGNREVTSLDVVNACAALTAFIDAAERLPPRTLAEWKDDIGNLRIALRASQ